jgi:probable phosphoglycerate mutase
MEIVRRELALPPDGYRTDARIAEIRYGHWEGHLLADLPGIDPDGFAARKTDIWNWQPVDGESYRMLSHRVAAWLGEISRDTIVASHGGVSRVLRGLILRLANADVAALEVPQDKVLMLRAGSAHWL